MGIITRTDKNGTRQNKTGISMGSINCRTISEPYHFVMGAAKLRCPWKYRARGEPNTVAATLQHYKGTLQTTTKNIPARRLHFEDQEGLVSNHNAQWLGNWIATRRPVSYESNKQAKQHSIENTPGITKWFRPKDKTTPRLCSWKRDQLRSDPFSKKKREKCHSQGYQPTLKHFLSLHGVLYNTNSLLH